MGSPAIWGRYGIPKEFWYHELLKIDNVGLRGVVERYIAGIEKMYENGIGLMLVGPNGTGKTLASVVILKGAIRHDYTGYFTSLGEVISATLAGWANPEAKEDFEHRIQNTQFLVLDDVGKEYRAKSGISEIIFDNLIRYRSQNMLPTLFTSNKPLAEIGTEYGKSLESLVSGRCLVAEVTGTDFRRTVLQQKIVGFFNGED
jgi:DNA replication protein DnaC